MIEMLKKLCAPIGISGFEDSVRKVIIEQISPYCDHITTDGIGNLIAFQKGKKTPENKIMLAAHMDEVGLIITYIEDSGLLRFTTVGGIDERILLGKRVLVQGTDRILPGVIGVKPVHLLDTEQKTKTLQLSDLYIDIGATSAAVAGEQVLQGAPVAFESEPLCFGDDKFKGRAIDDRFGCAVLIALIKEGAEYDTTYVFTVQEEVGTRGAQVAANTLDPDIALVLEATTAGDLNDIPENKLMCRLGDGAVVSYMDKGAIYDRQLYQMALDTALENHIPVQTKRGVAGGNDAASIHKAADGVRTLAISLPCRYLHSANCVISRQDMQSVFQLTKALLAKSYHM